jgi:hypothetical protein
LTSFSVNASNTAYSSSNDVLFNKAQTTLIQFPSGKTLSSYTIPSSVTSIAAYAFYGNNNLTSMTIPTGVTSIGLSTFSACSKLTYFSVVSTNANYSSSIDGVLCDKNQTQVLQYPPAKIIQIYTIPSTVTSISDTAFYGCSNLTTIILPASLAAIANKAFFNCSNLSTVYFNQTSSIPTLYTDSFSNNKSPNKAYYQPNVLAPKWNPNTYLLTTGLFKSTQVINIYYWTINIKYNNYVVFNGYFTTSSNSVGNVSINGFYDIYGNNVFLNSSAAGADNIFTIVNLSSSYYFTSNGTNIYPIPYFASLGNNSTYFRLYSSNSNNPNNHIYSSNGSDYTVTMSISYNNTIPPSIYSTFSFTGASISFDSYFQLYTPGKIQVTTLTNITNGGIDISSRYAGWDGTEANKAQSTPWRYNKNGVMTDISELFNKFGAT